MMSKAERALPAPIDVSRQRLAGRNAEAHRRKVEARRSIRDVEHRRIRRRHGEEQRRFAARGKLEDCFRQRPARIQDRRRADAEREIQRVAEPVGEEELGDRVCPLVLRDAQDVLAEMIAAERHVVVQMDRALGEAGRARAIEPKRGVVFAGLEGAELRRRRGERLTKIDDGDRRIRRQSAAGVIHDGDDAEMVEILEDRLDAWP